MTQEEATFQIKLQYKLKVQTKLFSFVKLKELSTFEPRDFVTFAKRLSWL